jgi:DivIVA domain-containing protein
MAQALLLLIVALTVGAVVFGVMVLVSGGDSGLREVEPDGRAVPLPGSRPLVEQDVAKTTFDLGLRGYRMDQVDRALKRVAYDIGYKDELINVLSSEVEALREGRLEDAEALRNARLAAANPHETAPQAAAKDDGDDSEPATDVIELGTVEPVRDASYQDEVPDGPFAPWPAEKAEKAATEETGDAEQDHPTDATGSSGTPQSESGDDRVVTRG